MTDFYWKNGLYLCKHCNKPFTPGHQVKCHPLQINFQRLKPEKNYNEKLETGMTMIHGCEEIDPPDLGKLLG